MPAGVKQFGKVGADVTEEEAYQTARAVALQMMSSIKEAVGDLDRVKRVIRLFRMVNSAPAFARQFGVIDGASDLFFRALGARVRKACEGGRGHGGAASRRSARDHGRVRGPGLRSATGAMTRGCS